MLNFVAILKNWKTTVLGIVPIIVAILGFFGFVELTPEELTLHVGKAFDVMIELILVIIGLIGVFSRDADKSSQDSGVRK